MQGEFGAEDFVLSEDQEEGADTDAKKSQGAGILDAGGHGSGWMIVKRPGGEKEKLNTEGAEAGALRTRRFEEGTSLRRGKAGSMNSEDQAFWNSSAMRNVGDECGVIDVRYSETDAELNAKLRFPVRTRGNSSSWIRLEAV